MSRPQALKTWTRAALTAFLRKSRKTGRLTNEQVKDIACSLIGHSNIVSTCFGYIYCGRCGTQTGDGLAGGGNPDCVIIGHNCETCQKNYKRLTWKDKFMCVSNPLQVLKP